MQPTKIATAGSTSLTPRLAFLDVIRGFAASMVVFYHICLNLKDVLPRPLLYFLVNWCDIGHFGVMLFFMVSGYIIPMSIERYSIREFWIRRFRRLYPAYWFALLLALAFIWLGWYTAPSNQFAAMPFPVALLNFSMIQRLFGIYDLLYPAWSLFPEIIFYILMSTLVLLKLVKYSHIIALLAILISILSVPWNSHVLVNQQITPYIAVMMTGTIFYRVTVRRYPVLLTYSVICLCGFMLLLLPEAANIVYARVGAFLLFLLLLYFKPAWAAVAYIGSISYSFYLLHPLVIDAIHTSSKGINALIWFVLSLLVAAGAYRWIEQPLLSSNSGRGVRIGQSR